VLGPQALRQVAHERVATEDGAALPHAPRTTGGEGRICRCDSLCAERWPVLQGPQCAATRLLRTDLCVIKHRIAVQHWQEASRQAGRDGSGTQRA
jgi:hypothetical protein